ncbi:MAG: MotA/TolQ/ExbB proton channel family protein [Sandaracinaceae bacterium]|nr:MotA/TolQ/ExbB proton channel family protein [Sandaracinaceae bacterium]
MLGATWVMWLLVGLSIIGLAIVFDRIYYFFSTRDDLPKLRRALQERYAEGDLEGAKKLTEASNAESAKIVGEMIDVFEMGPQSLEERLEGESAVTKGAMERNLAFLGTVGNNAPFVGLLGTVIGIIRAFHELDQSQGEVTSSLMAEIGEALVVTAIGLLVAIPAVAMYNYFGRVIRYRLSFTNAMASDLLALSKKASEKNEA